MIMVTRDQVRAALEAWFILARSGGTLSAQDTAKLSATDAAEASTDLFSDLLKRNAPKQDVPPVVPPVVPPKQDDLFA